MDIQQGALGHVVKVAKVSGAIEGFVADIASPLIEIGGYPISYWVESGTATGVAMILEGTFNGIDFTTIDSIGDADMDAHKTVPESGWPFVRFRVSAASGQLGNVLMMACEYMPT